jgi:NADH-quinone oxidoreductase subunit L
VKPVVVSALALVLVLIGVGIAIMKFLRTEVPVVAPENVSVFTKIARRDLLQDDFNEALFMRPGQTIITALGVADTAIIDGAVRGVAALTKGSGSVLRNTQTGFVRSYAMWILLGAIGLIAAIWVVTL